MAASNRQQELNSILSFQQQILATYKQLVDVVDGSVLNDEAALNTIKSEVFTVCMQDVTNYIAAKTSGEIAETKKPKKDQKLKDFYEALANLEIASSSEFISRLKILDKAVSTISKQNLSRFILPAEKLVSKLMPYIPYLEAKKHVDKWLTPQRDYSLEELANVVKDIEAWKTNNAVEKELKVAFLSTIEMMVRLEKLKQNFLTLVSDVEKEKAEFFSNSKEILETPDFENLFKKANKGLQKHTSSIAKLKAQHLLKLHDDLRELSANLYNAQTNSFSAISKELDLAITAFKKDLENFDERMLNLKKYSQNAITHILNQSNETLTQIKLQFKDEMEELRSKHGSEISNWPFEILESAMEGINQVKVRIEQQKDSLSANFENIENSKNEIAKIEHEKLELIPKQLKKEKLKKEQSKQEQSKSERERLEHLEKIHEVADQMLQKGIDQLNSEERKQVEKIVIEIQDILKEQIYLIRKSMSSDLTKVIFELVVGSPIQVIVEHIQSLSSKTKNLVVSNQRNIFAVPKVIQSENIKKFFEALQRFDSGMETRIENYTSHALSQLAGDTSKLDKSIEEKVEVLLNRKMEEIIKECVDKDFSVAQAQEHILRNVRQSNSQSYKDRKDLLLTLDEKIQELNEKFKKTSISLPPNSTPNVSQLDIHKKMDEEEVVSKALEPFKKLQDRIKRINQETNQMGQEIGSLKDSITERYKKGALATTTTTPNRLFLMRPIEAYLSQHLLKLELISAEELMKMNLVDANKKLDSHVAVQSKSYAEIKNNLQLIRQYLLNTQLNIVDEVTDQTDKMVTMFLAREKIKDLSDEDKSSFLEHKCRFAVLNLKKISVKDKRLEALEGIQKNIFEGQQFSGKEKIKLFRQEFKRVMADFKNIDAINMDLMKAIIDAYDIMPELKKEIEAEEAKLNKGVLTNVTDSVVGAFKNIGGMFGRQKTTENGESTKDEDKESKEEVTSKVSKQEIDTESEERGAWLPNIRLWKKPVLDDAAEIACGIKALNIVMRLYENNRAAEVILNKDPAEIETLKPLFETALVVLVSNDCDNIEKLRMISTIKPRIGDKYDSIKFMESLKDFNSSNTKKWFR